MYHASIFYQDGAEMIVSEYCFQRGGEYSGCPEKSVLDPLQYLCFLGTITCIKVNIVRGFYAITFSPCGFGWSQDLCMILLANSWGTMIL